jgi:hypothetical protein
MSDDRGLTEHNFLIDAPRERHDVGAMLFEEGEHGEELFVVARGRVLLSRRTQAGESVAVATIQAGGVLGEIALLQPGPRSASAVVMEDAEIVRVHSSAATPSPARSSGPARSSSSCACAAPATSPGPWGRMSAAKETRR